MKGCSYSEFFWSVFFRIRTGYREIRSISSYSVRMQKSMDQKNSEHGHFSCSELEQWRRQWIVISISLEHLQIGFSVSWKLFLNKCWRRWVGPSLNLVRNLISLGLWRLKILLAKACMKLSNFFSNILRFNSLVMRE